MARETIVQLGAGAWMRHTVRRLRAEGYRVVALDKDPLAPAFADADDHAVVDIVDPDAIERFARALPTLPDLLMVVNGAGVVSGAIASDRLGLPALAVEVAQRAQDKGRCREAWRAAGLPQPDYRIVDRVEQIATAAREVGYPVIVKPTRKWGSRGVTRAPDAAAIEGAATAAAAEPDPAPGSPGAFIVESCVSGLEVSVEGLVQDGKAHVLAVGDKEMQEHPRYRVGLVLRYPSALPAATLGLIEEVVGRAIGALGIARGAFDAECMVDEGRVTLIELNPRPGGGHIFGQIVETVSGVCMPLAYAKVMLGQPVSIAPPWRRGACYRFFAPPPGVFRGVSGLEAARASDGVLDVGFHLTPGTRIQPVAADADRPGFVLASGADAREADANAARALAKIAFTMSDDRDARDG